MARHLLGAHSARIELATHLTDQMRAALEREYPTRDDGGQQVGPRQALRLGQHSHSGDGCGPGLRQSHGPEGPLGPPARRWAGYVSRQVDVVAPWGDVPHVEVRLLPLLHRVDQRDDGEGVVGDRPPRRDEGASLSRHALHARAQHGLEELPPELEGGEDAEVALAQGDEG